MTPCQCAGTLRRGPRGERPAGELTAKQSCIRHVRAEVRLNERVTHEFAVLFAQPRLAGGTPTSAATTSSQPSVKLGQVGHVRYGEAKAIGASGPQPHLLTERGRCIRNEFNAQLPFKKLIYGNSDSARP